MKKGNKGYRLESADCCRTQKLEIPAILIENKYQRIKTGMIFDYKRQSRGSTMNMS